MALKRIDTINSKPVSFIKSFINNCTIEEKIDTHYVIVEITTKNSITIKKSSNKPIDRVDLILNNMWSKITTDWNYIRLANKEWFESHVGYTFYMFFLPTQKPLLTTYKPNITYIIDRILYNDELMDVSNIINSLKMLDQFHIHIKTALNKIDNVFEICQSITGENKKTLDFNNIFLALLKNNDNILALYKPEGFIYKWNNNVYQYLYEDPVKISPEKTQYEFLLCDFIQYCKSKSYIDKIESGYIKTICSLFNDYIINWESLRHNIENNIDINGITPPTNAENVDIGYEYIPNVVTLNLCKQNVLYKRIFCVLLSNLRKIKTHPGIYMSDKQQHEFNNIVKNINIRNVHI